MSKKFSYWFILIFLFASCSSNSQDGGIAVDSFAVGISRPASQILDVRTQQEYNSGHLKNALLAEWTNRPVFEARIQSLDKNKPVYVYCLSGGRSAAAAQRLKEIGFQQVYNLNGGMAAWKAANKDVEGRTSVTAVSLQEYLEKTKQHETVLVDFGAVWCPPCRKMDPILNELEKEANIVRIDGGVQDQLVKDLKISEFPTFIVYKAGVEVWRQSGLVSKEVLKQQLK